MHRLTEKEVLQRFEASRARFPRKIQEGMTLAEFEAEEIAAYRPPTQAEIRMGYGAIHYKDFPLVVWVKPKTGALKKWIKCEHDGLRYYR